MQSRLASAFRPSHKVSALYKPMRLSSRILNGEVRAIARAMTLIENEQPEAEELLKEIFPHTGRAQIIGVTGAPGTGKSTLVDKLVLAYRRRGKSVGVVAVDPTSPFSGGAILGDRVRMQDLYLDEGVFIRSMATRGHLGGLARPTAEVVQVLDAAGKDLVFVETVGVGQDEVEVTKLADVSLVLLVPGMGDDLQAIKAGLMEIADIFVINKADRADVDQLVRGVESALSLAGRPDGWSPPIVRSVASQGQGVEELMSAIEHWFGFRRGLPAAFDRRHSAQDLILQLLRDRLLETAIGQSEIWARIQAASEEVRLRKRDPYSVVNELIDLLRLGDRIEESS
ncbi:MAG: methylmalonyl Co-A mutase-associated GTPase MeaB [Acidobacteriota bacterium]